MILVYMCSLCNYIQQKNILNVTFSTEKKHFKPKVLLNLIKLL